MKPIIPGLERARGRRKKGQYASMHADDGFTFHPNRVGNAKQINVVLLTA